MVRMHASQSRLETGRYVGISGERNLLDRLGFTGCTFDIEFCWFPFEIFFIDFEQVPRNLSRLFANFAGSHRSSSSSYRSAATGVSTKARWCGIRISFFDRDVSNWNPKLLRDYLSKSRFMPLPLSFSPHPCNRLAGGMNSDFTAVEHFDTDYVEGVRWSCSHNLSKAGNADPHQLAFPAFVFLFFAQIAITDFFQRQVHRAVIIPAVIAPPAPALSVNLIRRTQIFNSPS